MQTYARLMMLGGLVGSLACAGSMAQEEDDISTRRDTTMVTDTAVVQTETDTSGVYGQQQDTTTPPGYSGMERDTTVFPYDTTNQGGVGQDTSGQGWQTDPGMGQDTSAQGYQAGQDTSGQGWQTDPGMGQDTSAMGADSANQGYQQYPSDTGADTSADSLQQHQQHDSLSVPQDDTSGTGSSSGYTQPQ